MSELICCCAQLSSAAEVTAAAAVSCDDSGSAVVSHISTHHSAEFCSTSIPTHPALKRLDTVAIRTRGGGVSGGGVDGCGGGDGDRERGSGAEPPADGTASNVVEGERERGGGGGSEATTGAQRGGGSQRTDGLRQRQASTVTVSGSESAGALS